MRPHFHEGGNTTLSKCSGILNLRKGTSRFLGLLNPQTCVLFFTIFSQILGIWDPGLHNLYEYSTNPGYKSNCIHNFSNFISTLRFFPSQIPQIQPVMCWSQSHQLVSNNFSGIWKAVGKYSRYSKLCYVNLRNNLH